MDNFSVSSMADSNYSFELGLPTRNRFLEALRNENPALDRAISNTVIPSQT